MNKAELRKEILNIRKTYNGKTDSEKICKIIENMPEYKNAEAVAAFMPYKSEVDIMPFIISAVKTKMLYLPITEEDDSIDFYLLRDISELTEGKYKIMQPKKDIRANSIDFMLVPGVVFDRHGHRIGYGKGCYDRYLKNKNIFTCAVGYEFQLKQDIPYEAHDSVVKAFADEKELLYF